MTSDTTDKVIPINRPKLTSVGGAPLGTGQGAATQQAPPSEAPEQFIYQIVTNDGTEFFENGYLIATPSFIGIGVGGGQLEALVPMESLRYVRKAGEEEFERIIGSDAESV